jgi:hypothetical protein
LVDPGQQARNGRLFSPRQNERFLTGINGDGARTGASFVRAGETGVVVDRLPLGGQCAESADDVRVLAVFTDAIEEAQVLGRHRVRNRVTRQFKADRIVDDVVNALKTARLASSVQAGPRI